MTQRHEVDEVVRMKVADHDRVQPARFDDGGEAGERALTEVEKDRHAVPTDEVGRSGRAEPIGVGRAGPEDDDLFFRSWLRACHARSATTK